MQSIVKHQEQIPCAHVVDLQICTGRAIAAISVQRPICPAPGSIPPPPHFIPQCQRAAKQLHWHPNTMQCNVIQYRHIGLRTGCSSAGIANKQLNNKSINEFLYRSSLLMYLGFLRLLNLAKIVFHQVSEFRPFGIF